MRIVTFEDKQAIFSLAKTAEYERSLSHNEIKMLAGIYGTCNENQKEQLKMDAYSVWEEVMEFIKS